MPGDKSIFYICIISTYTTIPLWTVLGIMNLIKKYQPLGSHKNHLRNLANTSSCTCLLDILTQLWIGTWESEFFIST